MVDFFFLECHEFHVFLVLCQTFSSIVMQRVAGAVGIFHQWVLQDSEATRSLLSIARACCSQAQGQCLSVLCCGWAIVLL